MASLDESRATSPSQTGRPPTSILVVDDDAAMCDWVKEELEHEGFAVDIAAGGRAGVQRVKAGGIDLVVSDVKMPDLDGLDLLREIREVEPSPFVIIVTGFGSIDTAIRAVKLGAHDYITKPFNIDQLVLSIDKALAERSLRSEVVRLREEVSRRDRLDSIIGRSAAMQEIFALMRRLSTSHANLLVTGESGTGKELVARALHARSPRKSRPFVALNCAAIPENLLESELFGYARGAHSTANADRQGLFVEANGGTLFLDEIAELPMPLQPKLLRVLQDGEIRPLGTNRSERVDVRVIAATNRDLERALREGRFREDLYYRLNVIPIHLPPLRGRQEDILPLADHFLARAAARSGKTVKGWKESAKKLLLSYHWPGNVRELENVVERVVALTETDLVGPEDLPRAMQERKSQDLLANAVTQGLTLDQLEREYIERVLDVEGGNKTRAAQRLGLDRKTLYRKLEEYAATPRGKGADPEDRGEGR
ncbi:MAG: sigma-54-dependent Fis family transcriptional regulator [Deltaproteobacteria bacterium]|jgi:DNA-binding NtrC family response regulator|nr:sigma-54-dependent Fis family transcriptional regulator [Deltaproteobacteria bacterium]